MIRPFVEMAGYPIEKKPKSKSAAVYKQDGLRSVHNHEFMKDPEVCEVYDRGCRAATDYKWHWRVQIGLWAGFTASKLEGDFVECGVNHGFLSSAIMEYLD